MPKTAVTTEVHEALDVQLNFTTQVTFYLVLGLDDLTDGLYLVVREFVSRDGAADAGFVEHFLRSGSADTKDVGERDVNALLAREINSSNS
jgi:hypothetical protein